LRVPQVFKNLACRLPGRPFIVFLYLYFVRLGFFDGRAGLTYAGMRSVYEYMIDLKVPRSAELKSETAATKCRMLNVEC
jgi:hypothetical protein